jgi:hypothetical protein
LVHLEHLPDEQQESARVNDSVADQPQGLRTLEELLEELCFGAANLGLIVGPSAPKRLVDALLVLARSELRAFSVRFGGDATAHRLIEIEPRSDPAHEEFFAKLPPAARALAKQVARRLSRIDDELVCAAEPGSLHWKFRGIFPLAAIHNSGAALSADIGGGREPRELQDERDVNRFVERALLEHLAALEGLRSRGAPRRERPGASTISPREPLLSAEELAAFRD